MLDHVSLRVSNLEQALPLYKAALAPLGYQVAMEFPGFIGFSDGRGTDFWLTATDKPVNPAHVAFSADRPGVHAFYDAALGAGAKDNGPPGPRAEYHPHYYGAFILDADGNNIEAVCHRPAGEAAPTAKKPRAKAAAKPKAKAAARPKPKAAARPKAKAVARPKAKAAAKPKAKAAKPGKAAKPKARGRR